jgi:hypothetical protein
LIGTWGGNDTRVTVDRFGGVLSQQCYQGTFPPPVVDAQGRFDVTGTSVRKQKFPEPATPAPVATRYQGRLIGSRLSLTMTVLYPEAEPWSYPDLPFLSMDPLPDPWTPCA